MEPLPQEPLEELIFIELTVLHPPTFPALRKALTQAHRRQKPFHVVHFDGHRIYNSKVGLGLCVLKTPMPLSGPDAETKPLMPINWERC